MNLKDRLQQTTAHRAIRDKNANFVLSNPNLLSELVSFCFVTDQHIAIRACWVFEVIGMQQPNNVIVFLNEISSKLHTLSNDSAKRPMLHVMYHLLYLSKKDENIEHEFTLEIKEKLTEICFDWLIDNSKVATKCYAMRCLAIIGKEKDWIYPELELILKENIHKHTAAYTAASKDVLKQIAK